MRRLAIYAFLTAMAPDDGSAKLIEMFAGIALMGKILYGARALNRL